MTLDRTTILQSLLLGAALLGGLAIILIVMQETSARRELEGTPSGPVVSDSATGGSPAAETVRLATALSDSLHDRAESLARWIAASPDTAGLQLRTDSLMQAVDRSIEQFGRYSFAVSAAESEQLISLFLDYLEAPSLAELPPAERQVAAEAYLTGLESARAEVESSLIRYLGRF